MSWPPCATPRSMSADSPDIPTSPPPNATTAGHPTPPSTPSSPHDQLDRRRSAPFHDLAMPLDGLPRDRRVRGSDRGCRHRSRNRGGGGGGNAPVPRGRFPAAPRGGAGPPSPPP